MLAVFKIADVHLSASNNFRTDIRETKQLEKDPVLPQMLTDIKLDKHARRIMELLRGFKRDMLDNCLIQLNHGDKSEIDEEVA